MRTRTRHEDFGQHATRIRSMAGVMRAMRRMVRYRYCPVTSGSMRSASGTSESRPGGGTDMAPLPGSLSCAQRQHITDLTLMRNRLTHADSPIW